MSGTKNFPGCYSGGFTGEVVEKWFAALWFERPAFGTGRIRLMMTRRRAGCGDCVPGGRVH